jgi:thiamine-monophosphate kinase
MADTVSSIGERALVDRLQARVGPIDALVHLGIGDDAAVIEPVRGALQVVTTDSVVEHIHFRRDWSSPETIGHKALAVNLSDLAAMGATPHAALLSLAMPDDFPLADFDALVDGFLRLATKERTTLIGGNLTRSPGPLVVDVTAIGWVGRRRLLRRVGARRGDELWVTGTLGAAATGLAVLQRALPRPVSSQSLLDCVERYERPVPQTRAGRMVGKTKSARAAIDLSDGLADGARRLAEAAELGVVLNAEALPIHPGATEFAQTSGLDPLGNALAGGEDYELAFVVSPKERRKFLAAIGRAGNPAVTRVGVFTPEPGAWIEQEGKKRPVGEGFSHFVAGDRESPVPGTDLS